MSKVIYPGSFDPITNGHLDIIKRVSKLFDEVVIGIFTNTSKKSYWFNVDERIKLIQKVLNDNNINNAKVIKFSGLLVDYINKNDIDILIRGLRAVSDYEYELQLTLTNSTLTENKFETLFLTSSREYLYLSSSLVKEIAINNGKLTHFIPNIIIDDIIKRAVEIKNGK